MLLRGGESMKLTGAKKQTAFLTAVNAVVRALGLIMRIWMSRLVGAEVMGVMELAQSVHMTAIAPLTSGLPVAVTRLTAKAHNEEKDRALASGLFLVRRLSLILVPVLWLLSPVVARCMGDIRVLPSLWFTAPCILILGYSAAYNGYCYGLENSYLPAFSELIEQVVRFALTIFLLSRLRFLTPAWQAAIPVSATMTAEIIGLWFVIVRASAPRKGTVPSFSCTKTIFRLSAPATLTRLFQTLLRSLTAILIPIRLQNSGLSAAEATAQLGMLNGMVTPILMMPGVFTSALSMVLIPRIAKAEEKPSELGRLFKLSICSTLPLAALCAALVYFFSPLLAVHIYRQPDLTSMFQHSAWQIMLFPINHLLYSALSALGQQRLSLYASILSSAATLLLTWWAAGNPALRVNGIICAQYASQFLSIALACAALFLWKRGRRSTPDGISA